MIHLTYGVSVLAQNRGGFFCGTIIDSISHSKIPDVNINILNTSKGTVSDKEGKFCVSVSDFPCMMQISHVGYHIRKITINNRNDLDKESIVFLKPKIISLNETLIRPSVVQTFYKDHKVSVLDYEILDDKIIILTYKDNLSHQSLILMNQNMDTITSLRNFNIRGVSVVKDCLGNCHILGRKRAYQIDINIYDSSIRLIYPVDIETFSRNFDPCLFEVSKHLIFEIQNNRFLKTYIGVNKESHEIKPIARVFDRKKAKAYTEFIAEQNTRLNKTLYDHKDDPIIKNKASHDFEHEMNFARMIAFKPAYTPLLLYQDTLLLFDHINGEITKYDRVFRIINTQNIHYHKRKKWKEKILLDKHEGSAYTLFISNNKLKLINININSGKTEQAVELKNPFPEKLKIHDGFAYYLHKQRGNIWDKKSLYRIKIKQIRKH
jgi:hypothetical protein